MYSDFRIIFIYLFISFFIGKYREIGMLSPTIANHLRVQTLIYITTENYTTNIYIARIKATKRKITKPKQLNHHKVQIAKMRY